MNYEDLTTEQLEKAKACSSAKELVALAEEEGVELTDEQLEQIAGGDFEWEEAVPKMYYA